MTVRELVTKIGFDVDEGKMKKAQMRMQKFKSGMKFAALGIVAGVAAIGGAAVKAASDMEMLETQFEVMLGSAEKAAGMMEELKTFAAGTPFQLNDLAQGTQTLLSFGVAENQVIQTMRMLGDTAGGNREKLNGLILAYGKVMTKGKASMEEINMIAERGIPIIGTLTEQLGVTEQQFFKLVSQGKIGRAEITNAFKTMTNEGGIFFQGMEKASLTFSGLVSTMKDNLTLMAAEIGNTLLPTAKELIKIITELIKGPLGELIGEIAGALKPILEIVGPLIGDVTKILLKLMPSITSLIKFTAKLISAILPPLIKILDVVIGLVAMIIDIGLDAILEPLIPLISMILEIIAEVLVILNPLLKIILKISGAILKIGLKIVIGYLKIVLNSWKSLFRVLKGVIGILWNKLSPILGKIWTLVSKIIEPIKDFATNIIQKAINGLNTLIDLANIALPESLQIKRIEGMEDEATRTLREAIDRSRKTMNVKQEVQATINAPVGPAGTTGLTPEGLVKATQDAAKAAFSIELRKVLISAG